MSDLISKESLIKSIDYIATPGGIWGKPFEAYKEAFKEFVEGMPSAENKGKWTIETIGEIPGYRDTSIYEPIYRCSCCGMLTESYVRFEKPIMPEDSDFPNYCPYCGARMEVSE